MMNLKDLLKTFGALLVGILMLNSCSTELDINAPYEEYTIVFGTIDQSVDTQWIKINKSFLGDGSAFDYAQIRDSNEYSDDDLIVEVQQWNENGQQVATFPLQSKEVNNVEPGVFYYPDQTVYYFVQPDVDEDSDYRIVGTAKGKEFSSETVVVNDFTVTRPNPIAGKINLASSLGNYNEYGVEWNSAINGKRYEVFYVFKWNEVTSSGSELKTLTRHIVTRKSSGTNGGEDLEGIIGGEDFYKYIENNVAEDPDVIRREFVGMDFLFEAADDILNTYMELNEPVTGVVQDRPAFTNVNNGLGIFASRYNKIIPDKKLNIPSLIELSSGQYTGPLLFCSPDPAHNGLPYGCF